MLCACVCPAGPAEAVPLPQLPPCLQGACVHRRQHPTTPAGECCAASASHWFSKTHRQHMHAAYAASYSDGPNKSAHCFLAVLLPEGFKESAITHMPEGSGPWPELLGPLNMSAVQRLSPITCRTCVRVTTLHLTQHSAPAAAAAVVRVVCPTACVLVRWQQAPCCPAS